MMWLLMWLNRNVATINVTLQFLDIYIYIYRFPYYLRDEKFE